MSDNCFICETPDDGVCLCDKCARAFDRATKKDDGTIMAVMQWAAKRARRFERKLAALERGKRHRRLTGRMSRMQ